ncbi:MAG: MscL family protein [bacterium]
MPVRAAIKARAKAPLGVVAGFTKFIHEYGILPLAVGVVIGTAVNDLVKNLVDGLVSPFIALLTPGGTLQNFQLTVHGSVFKIGLVLNAVVSFLIIAFIVYAFAKIILRNEEILKK